MCVAGFKSVVRFVSQLLEAVVDEHVGEGSWRRRFSERISQLFQQDVVVGGGCREQQDEGRLHLGCIFVAALGAAARMRRGALLFWVLRRTS